MADSAGPVVAETEMHADICVHSVDGPCQCFQEEVGLTGMAGEAGLVELDEVDPRSHQGFQLGVHDRRKRRVTAFAIVVDCTTIDAARKCERPGDGHLDRGRGVFAEPAIFSDRAQAAWVP